MDVRILTYNVHGLPWSRDQRKKIATWISQQNTDIVCLQEVFTSSARMFYTQELQRAGYTMVSPMDTGVTLLSSGLLTGYRTAKFRCLSSVFCTFQTYHNVEWFANKGFHVLRLQSAKGSLHIVNTHTQSNTEISAIFGEDVVHRIRKEQFGQIYRFFEYVHTPILVVGDVNCEKSPHPEFRFLSYLHNNLFHKSTFQSTGEDLDHVAWIPSQYAPHGCSMCDIERFGPQLLSCLVAQIYYSDHFPVLFHINVPSR